MAKVLKAKEISDRLKKEIAVKIESLKAEGINVKMATILIEGDPASDFYVQAKKAIADKLGIIFELKKFPNHVRETIVLQELAQLNADPSVHGIMMELPLPKHLSTEKITEVIDPLKDVDGLTPANKIATVMGTEGIYPATPLSCISLLQHYGYPLEGKNVCLVGFGKTVGFPLFHLLIRERATVTVCHAYTKDLAFHIQNADYLFVAVGKAGLITPEMVHPQLVIIDAGINETEQGEMVGDAAPTVKAKVAAMSPTPGGVGTLTSTILFQNLLKAVDLQQKKGWKAR
ncbi:bifunctional 5,10-methylenetetrahydrofolate dehydrogenase/5,10-methenyltetrahydrofolate cyclohydrolase [Bacillaceae bacterium Marseille-Q3522]|nr:bifunctional 5,10-methylenetetrahydrofolate dehydrogenase/5,10-methenyltetrahydrofolate cyclohydrolase [Bacillaceae bacterium Marseille-Q3522]